MFGPSRAEGIKRDGKQQNREGEDRQRGGRQEVPFDEVEGCIYETEYECISCVVDTYDRV